jgi:hypothetical protein
MRCEDFADEDDPVAARRRWNDELAAVDAEIREEARPEVIEERRLEAANRERLRSLPPVRLRPGVPASRLTDQEAALLDRHGY